MTKYRVLMSHVGYCQRNQIQKIGNVKFPPVITATVLRENKIHTGPYRPSHFACTGTCQDFEQVL